MRGNRPGLCGGLLLALLFAGAGSLRAEILCEEPQDAEGGECRYLLIAGITEEPDPISMAGEGQLVPLGMTPPDVVPHAIEPRVLTQNGVTVAVWASSTGGNGDIIFSQWHPDGWQEHALTYRGSDERDPRVDIAEDGAIYVTWWETEAPQRVRVARRDPVSFEWEQPVTFAGMYGGRPGVLALQDEVLVVYESRHRSGGQHVVARWAQQSGGVGWSEEVVARTDREEPLNVEVHVQGDRPFIDWIHRTNFFGYSEYQDGQWGASLDSRPLTHRHWLQFPGVQRVDMTRSR